MPFRREKNLLNEGVSAKWRWSAIWLMPELKANYDFIFIPVLHRLKTHQYWQRWGAKEFYRDADCVCYKLDI